MNTNEIYLNSDIINDYKAYLDKNAIQIKEAISDSQNNFGGLRRNNIYSNGFNKIETSMNKIKNVIESCNKVMVNYTEKFFTYEDIATNEIEKLIIPKNFMINDSMEIHDAKSISLNKQDGISINTGVSQTDEKKLETEYANVKIQNVGTINNSRETIQQNINTETSIQQPTNFRNINDGSGQNIQELNSNYSIHNKVINSNVKEQGDK